MPVSINGASSDIDLIALSAGFIALCALVVSIWQAYLGRRHNRLSCRPLIEFFATATTDRGISITVKNCGLGPATLRSTWITYDSVKYNVSDRDSFQELLDRWGEQGLPRSTVYASSPHSDAIVAAGDGFDIMRVVESEDMPEAMRFFRDAFRNTVIEIRYESLYEESFDARYKQEHFAADPQP